MIGLHVVYNRITSLPLHPRSRRVLYKEIQKNTLKSRCTNMFSTIKTLFADLETPKYEVEQDTTEDGANKTKGYEVRTYQDTTTWVTTSESTIEAPSTDTKQTKKSREMFFELFGYISGKNDKNQKIEMTAPVLRKITAGAGPFCKTTKDMSFYVTKEFQGNPPAPTAENVYVTHLPAQRVVARVFDGYTSEAKDLEQARILSELTQDKYELEQDYFFTAAYNSPWRVVGRRNEVWFVIKGDKNNENAKVESTVVQGSSVE